MAEPTCLSVSNSVLGASSSSPSSPNPPLATPKNSTVQRAQTVQKATVIFRPTDRPSSSIFGGHFGPNRTDHPLLPLRVDQSGGRTHFFGVGTNDGLHIVWDDVCRCCCCCKRRFLLYGVLCVVTRVAFHPKRWGTYTDFLCWFFGCSGAFSFSGKADGYVVSAVYVKKKSIKARSWTEPLNRRIE